MFVTKNRNFKNFFYTFGFHNIFVVNISVIISTMYKKHVKVNILITSKGNIYFVIELHVRNIFLLILDVFFVYSGYPKISLSNFRSGFYDQK